MDEKTRALSPGEKQANWQDHLGAAVRDGYVGRRWLPFATSAARDWQPIDTAPKDGTHILAWLPENEGPNEFDKNQPAPWIVLRWDGRNWIEPHYDAFVYFPTKWMPLPEPPK